jgi:hypothetical protein
MGRLSTRTLVAGVFAAALVMFCAGVAGAQAVKGGLVGNIVDASGSALPGVTVTITEVNTNIAYTTVTNESGNYVFANLKDGTYRVSGELSGFKKTVRDGVIVPVNATLRVDLKLEIGAIEESINVVGESPLLQTDRADTSRIIESLQLTEQPLGFNRNFQGMMITVPGALRMQRPHSDFFNAQDSLSSNVNGQSRLANNVQIEGIDDNHRTGLLTTLIPSAEAIETVNISTSAYDAEFGRAGGAITNVTLKSGTNSVKGSVFAFGNNEKTNAPGYFTHTAPPGDYLQSGFTLGGPIQRNKLFFFGDYQNIRDNAGRTTRSVIPPTAYRLGDFSASPTKIYDPLTGNADGTGRTPFPNNIIPADRISPIATAILANLPQPNVSASPGQPNYQVDYARVKTTNSFDTKLNWQLGQRDQISGRFSFLRPKLVDPAEFGVYGGSKQGSPSGNGFSGEGVDTTYSLGLNYTRTFTSTLVMEARGGMNYFRNQALSGGDGLKTAADIGIRGANIDEWTSGMTQIDIGNSMSSPLVGFAASLPWDRSERTVQFASVFTKIAGNHTIKVGEDFRHTRDFLLQTQDNGGPRGQFQFRANQTAIPSDAAATAGFANGFASFLLDVPSLVQRDLKVTDPGVRFWAFFTFIQDKWAVTPKLTIDLGLRHEYYTPFIGLADQGGLSNYDPATNTLQVAGYGNVGESVGVQKYLKNFGPRAGASYRLNDKTVLRGGYGVSTLPFPDNAYVYNYPVKQNNVLNAPNNFAPAGSMKAGFPDQVFVQIPSNGILDASPTVLRNASYFHVRPDMHEGSLHSFNVAFQRELPAHFSLDVAYVGNRGHDTQTQFNENAATVVGQPGNNGRPLFLPFGKSADVTTWIGTKTEYNSLQVKLDRRFSGGLLVTSSYTLGRGLSYVNGDSNTGIATPADISLSWARTDQDRLHSLVESFLYQIPVGPGRHWLTDGPLSQILGGWQLSGIFSAQSGSPIGITMANANLNAPGNTQRPNQTGEPAVLGAVGPGALWFDTAVFSSPANNVFGNAPRNGSIDGPRYVNLDATLAKLFAFPRNIKGEFRVDIFNITNTPHFNNPNGTFLGSTFGQITSTIAGSERSMRFGFRMMF